MTYSHPPTYDRIKAIKKNILTGGYFL